MKNLGHMRTVESNKHIAPNQSIKPQTPNPKQAHRSKPINQIFKNSTIIKRENHHLITNKNEHYPV